MRVIIQNQTLATDMEAEYKQWDDFCMDLEDNVSIDAREARKQDFGHTKVDDDANGKGKAKAKDPTLYGGAPAAHESKDDPRHYGRVAPRAPKTAWGYRKFDPPTSKAKTHFPRLTSLPEEDPDETEDEADRRDVRGGGEERDFEMDSQASTERGLGSPMSLSDRTDGVEEVMNFEEAFDEDEGPDQEMEDGGLGARENVQDEGMGDDNGDGREGKKGLVSGEGKVLGLYGEEL